MKTIVSTSAKVPNACSWTATGIEEDDLDVEQDEEHRDQVEADPEAEALLDLRRQAALVRVALGRALPAACGPMNELRTAKAGPGTVPRPTKTSAGR